MHKRCKNCYPGSPLDQCQLEAGHAGSHFMVPRENSSMWAGTKEITWETDWTPRPLDREFLAACKKASLFYKIYENPLEMVEIMKRTAWAPKDHYAA